MQAAGERLGIELQVSYSDDAFVVVLPREADVPAGEVLSLVGPEDLDVASVYDLTGAMEIQWYEDIGLCKEGDAEKLLREGATSMGGRIPVCTDGGCTSSGECIPAQALAETYEIVTQLRGDGGQRQVEGARIGFSVNSGKLGNSSAIVYKR